MPALWITRREGATAHPAPRREQLSSTNEITQEWPPTPSRQLPPRPPYHPYGLPSPAVWKLVTSCGPHMCAPSVVWVWKEPGWQAGGRRQVEALHPPSMSWAT